MSNYLRKPTKRRKQAGAIDLGGENEESIIIPPPPKRPPDRNLSYDHLGENDAMFERNKEKNFDGKKIRGLNLSGFQDMVS